MSASSSPVTAVEHYEYEYLYSSDSEEPSPPSPPPRHSSASKFGKEPPSGTHRILSLRSRGRSNSTTVRPVRVEAPIHKSVRRIDALQGRFSKTRSNSTTVRPAEFKAPPITDFSTSDLPDKPDGRISRFNPRCHKHIWFVIDTTSFARERSNIRLLKLLNLFRNIESGEMTVHAILFYDDKVVDALSYEKTDEPVDRDTYVQFGGVPNTFPRLTKKQVRKIIRKYVKDNGSDNSINVEYRTIARAAQNTGGRIALFGTIAYEILATRSEPMDIPSTLLIFAAQTGSSSHDVSEQGMEYVRSMHGDGMVWTVRGFTEISMLHGEIMLANEDAGSSQRTPRGFRR